MELLTALDGKVVQHFALRLQNQHVLICTDNKAKAAFINHQGGVHSAQFLSIARQLLCWVHTRLLSFRAMYIPGKLHRGVDIMRALAKEPSTDLSDLDQVKILLEWGHNLQNRHHAVLKKTWN